MSWGKEYSFLLSFVVTTDVVVVGFEEVEGFEVMLEAVLEVLDILDEERVAETESAL